MKPSTRFQLVRKQFGASCRTALWTAARANHALNLFPVSVESRPACLAAWVWVLPFVLITRHLAGRRMLGSSLRKPPQEKSPLTNHKDADDKARLFQQAALASNRGFNTRTAKHGFRQAREDGSRLPSEHAGRTAHRLIDGVCRLNHTPLSERRWRREDSSGLHFHRLAAEISRCRLGDQGRDGRQRIGRTSNAGRTAGRRPGSVNNSVEPGWPVYRWWDSFIKRREP